MIISDFKYVKRMTFFYQLSLYKLLYLMYFSGILIVFFSLLRLNY